MAGRVMGNCFLNMSETPTTKCGKRSSRPSWDFIVWRKCERHGSMNENLNTNFKIQQLTLWMKTMYMYPMDDRGYYNTAS